MPYSKNYRLAVLAAASLAMGGMANADASTSQRIGVLYAVHGGAGTWSDQAAFDTAMQMFAYDRNSIGYRLIVWNPMFWPLALTDPTATAQTTKFNFSYARIGGSDPFDALTDKQLADMSAALNKSASIYNKATKSDIRFFTGRMSWIGTGAHIADLPNPRGIYYPQITGPTGPPPYVPQNMTYCGSAMDGGPWPGCDPERYNIDGAVERMLANDIDRLIIIDTTTTGVRFFKTFEQLQEAKKVVAAYNAANGANVTVEWVNDPNGLMEASYPTAPENWTYSLGAPAADASVPLAGNPNPVTDDPVLAWVIAPGIEQAFNKKVRLKDTGVVLMNHAIRDHAQWYDPKIDDTLVLNRNIRSALTTRNRQLGAENILGAWFGHMEFNPYANRLERTRAMRGENLGENFLYETNHERPTGQDGYLYWDALDELRRRGLKHIVIVFPQIVTDSVLSLVEVPNQVAKEIGFKNYVGWANPDFATYPGVGHPFSGIWGNWAEPMCLVPGSSDPNDREPCCFTMGGCPGSVQPYPPERQTALTSAIRVSDPALAYHVSDFGHLGYEPVLGAPNPDAPVQGQYQGTWDMYRPVSGHPQLGLYLALKVWQHVLTNP